MEQNDIKTLSDFKDELHRCSKCGLCQAACPLYKLTGNECTVSRGQFIMLDGVVKEKLKLNKNINKYLDLCLKCNKCSEFCPSEINVVDILLSAKHDYFKNSVEGKIYSFLESKMIFNSFLKVLEFIGKLFYRKKKSKKFDQKVVWFGGCVSKFNPSLNNFITGLLNAMNIEVIDIDFNCCGMPFLTTGNIERFIEQAEENLSKLPVDFEYIITDCASCEWAWKQYSKYITNDALKAKLNTLKFKNIYDFIAESDINFTSKKYRKITYHKPCHEKSGDNILKIIKNIENTEYIDLPNMDECCGFSSFEHPKTLSTNFPIMKSKRDNILSTNADTVVTTCAGCFLSIKLMLLTARKKVSGLLSFLKSECFVNKE